MIWQPLDLSGGLRTPNGDQELTWPLCGKSLHSQALSPPAFPALSLFLSYATLLSHLVNLGFPRGSQISNLQLALPEMPFLLFLTPLNDLLNVN